MLMRPNMAQTAVHGCHNLELVPRGPFCHALEICITKKKKKNRDPWPGPRPEPIRFVRLDSGHAQSDGKSTNRGLGQRSRSLSLTKRITASGNGIVAATARVIWLCACVRYWPGRGLVLECVTCF